MQITEIYKSIQGESTYAGLPCVFVRLTGCNLRCTWCDSEYTFIGGQRMELGQVMAEVERLSPDGGLVEITGGEPMLQEREVVPLMQSLLDLGYTVLLSPAFRKDASGARDTEHCLLDPQQLAEWMLADCVPARLSLQIHKFIWDPVMKGV